MLRVGPGLVERRRRPARVPWPAAPVQSSYGEDRNYWKSQFVNELPDELIDEPSDA